MDNLFQKILMIVAGLVLAVFVVTGIYTAITSFQGEVNTQITDSTTKVRDLD